jgi:hypothetical protein
LPAALGFKPSDTIVTVGEFGHESGVNIAALVATPAYKTGTPAGQVEGVVP